MGKDNGCLGFGSANLPSKCAHSKPIWKPAEDKRAGKPLEKTKQKPVAGDTEDKQNI
jgi:hypothetical protein